MKKEKKKRRTFLYCTYYIYFTITIIHNKRASFAARGVIATTTTSFDKKRACTGRHARPRETGNTKAARVSFASRSDKTAAETLKPSDGLLPIFHSHFMYFKKKKKKPLIIKTSRHEYGTIILRVHDSTAFVMTCMKLLNRSSYIYYLLMLIELLGPYKRADIRMRIPDVKLGVGGIEYKYSLSVKTVA